MFREWSVLSPSAASLCLLPDSHTHSTFCRHLGELEGKETAMASSGDVYTGTDSGGNDGCDKCRIPHFSNAKQRADHLAGAIGATAPPPAEGVAGGSAGGDAASIGNEIKLAERETLAALQAKLRARQRAKAKELADPAVQARQRAEQEQAKLEAKERPRGAQEDAAVQDGLAKKSETAGNAAGGGGGGSGGAAGKKGKPTSSGADLRLDLRREHQEQELRKDQEASRLANEKDDAVSVAGFFALFFIT